MKFKTIAKRVLPLFYWLAVSLPHHPFSDWFDKAILIPDGFYTIQHDTDILSAVTLVFVLLLGVRVFRIHRIRALRYLGACIAVLLLMYAADEILIVNNIERIHFPQYAILALLLGLSLRSEMLNFFVTVFAGFVDEFLQYAMRPEKTNYLDFNDIVLNTLGAAFGIVLLMGLRKPLAETAKEESNREARQETAKKEKRFELSILNIPWRSLRSRRFAFPSGSTDLSRHESIFGQVFRISMAVGAAVVLVAGLFGRIVLLVEQAKDRSVFAVVNGKLSFIMSFERHDEFWIKSYFGKVFHVLSVGEGLLAITVLSLGTWAAVRWLRRGGATKPNQ